MTLGHLLGFDLPLNDSGLVLYYGHLSIIDERVHYNLQVFYTLVNLTMQRHKKPH
jgi:hypothetical protein